MTDKEKSFLDAASKGHVRKVAAFLKAGVDVNLRDERGTPNKRTALMHAAEKGHLRVVELLLEAGAQVNAIDKGVPIDCPGGNTALILAIREGHVDVAFRLLDAGASPKTKGGGTSVITAAADLGEEKLFERIIASGAELTRPDGSGFTAISSAVLNGQLKIVKLLLARGVSPSSQMPHRSPVLVDAALGLGGKPEQLEICKALVDAGADPNLGTEGNFTPLMAACRGIQPKTIQYLLSLKVRVNELDREYGRTALDIIIELQEPPNFAPDVLKRLIKLGEIDISASRKERLKRIASMLRGAGAKTGEELKAKQTG